ncbi:hypothetical protein, variant [Saprolegnia diclina VS20]|nr:hypothetical protein, variant [Saprolegnia diclina VS20]EQC25686.1 hypothetical protein, variant [Saprolegnia diclina VS20]|eukprot:XP_008620905.1 hypothetical protein, variant [Saprolegnia diclina VS20]
MGDLSECFFTADAEDMARVAAEIRDKHPEHIGKDIPERLLKNRVRRYVQDPETIKTKVESLIKKYRDVPGLFKKSIDDTHANAMVDLDLGYICDEKGISLYTDIGTSDNPRYVTVRSTSQLENLHHILRSCVHGTRLSMTTLHCILMDRIFRRNLTKRSITTKYHGPRLLDPHLAMQVKALMVQLQPTNQPNWLTSVPTIAARATDESFGVVRRQHMSSALRALERARAAIDEARQDDVDAEPLSWAMRRSGVVAPARAVLESDEKFLYRFLVESKRSTDDTMIADAWNDLLISWWLTKRDVVPLALSSGKALDVTVANVALKNTRHIVLYAKELNDARHALASTGADRLAQIQFKDSRPRKVLVPTPFPLRDVPRTTNQPIGGYEAVANEVAPPHAPRATAYKRHLGELTDGGADDSRPKTKRQYRPCPVCLCPHRNHRQRGFDECPLHKFYKANKDRIKNGPGGSGITAYDKAIAEWNELQSSTDPAAQA